MKKRCFLALVALLSLNAYSQEHPADTLNLTLDECIRIALTDNPTIKVADMEIQRVDYSKKETLGQLLPSIAFGGSYNRTLAKQVTYFNTDAFKGMGSGGGEGETGNDSPSAGSSANSGLKVGLDNMYSVGFSASMPLIAPQFVEITETLRQPDITEYRIGPCIEIIACKSGSECLLLVATRAGRIPGDKKESGDSNL